MIPCWTMAQIRIDEAAGLITIDGFAISLSLIRHMAEANPRVLWRFVVRGGALIACCYTEEQVVWTGEGEAGEFVVGVKG